MACSHNLFKKTVAIYTEKLKILHSNVYKPVNPNAYHPTLSLRILEIASVSFHLFLLQISGAYQKARDNSFN